MDSERSRAPDGPGKRYKTGVVYSLKANPEKYLPDLIGWLDRQRIKRMRRGEAGPASCTTADVNRALFPWYDKAEAPRKAASPGLLLLRAAEQRGWVRQTNDNGSWVDIRHTVSIGEAMKRKGAAK